MTYNVELGTHSFILSFSCFVLLHVFNETCIFKIQITFFLFLKIKIWGKQIYFYKYCNLQIGNIVVNILFFPFRI